MPVVELDLEAIHWVDNGNGLHPRWFLGGHSPLGGGQQLGSQGFDDHLGQLLANTAPHATPKGHVAEATPLARLVSLWEEALGVEQFWTLVHRSGFVRVSDAVQDTPAFRNLASLEEKKESKE